MQSATSTTKAKGVAVALEAGAAYTMLVVVDVPMTSDERGKLRGASVANTEVAIFVRQGKPGDVGPRELVNMVTVGQKQLR